ncbi:MAG: hypothetical protein HY900_00575 [Deltaproteobacteria bacterium]|nr:hypothetical protein [Deltaproteobacteria bacterium]
MSNGKNAFAIGDILDCIERSAKTVAKSLDSMRDRVDCDRLGAARRDLHAALGQIDALLASAAGAS